MGTRHPRARIACQRTGDARGKSDRANLFSGLVHRPASQQTLERRSKGLSVAGYAIDELFQHPERCETILR